MARGLPTGPEAFDGGAVRALLTELGRRLNERGLEARVFVVGGAAMALAYRRDRLTRDIDAVFEPKSEVYAEAKLMADDLRLPDNWLNDGVKGLMPDRAGTELATATFTAPGIAVGVASAEYLFAMKASAARSEVDRDDLRLLIGALNITSIDEAFDVLERHYERGRLSPKSQFVLEELVAEYLAAR